jgi:predicted nucleic acid-binding protein
VISVDSHGWIERFGGGPKQGQYNRVIDATSPDQIVTSAVTVYEVYRKAKPLRGEHAALEDVAALGHPRLVPWTRKSPWQRPTTALNTDFTFRRR